MAKVEVSQAGRLSIRTCTAIAGAPWDRTVRSVLVVAAHGMISAEYAMEGQCAQLFARDYPEQGGRDPSPVPKLSSNTTSLPVQLRLTMIA